MTANNVALAVRNASCGRMESKHPDRVACKQMGLYEAGTNSIAFLLGLKPMLSQLEHAQSSEQYLYV